MSPFASKVLKELQRSPETTLSFFTMRDLAAVEKFVGGPRESLEDMPPSHRYWLVLSGLAVKSTETTARFTTLRKLGELVTQAHDTYTPGEETPLLESTWMTWWLLDLPCGPARETYVSMLSEIAPALGAPPWLTSALRTLAESRLGVYRVEAIGRDRVHLTELITERTFDVVLTDEHDSRAPLWLARVMPPPDGSSGDSALLDEPYALRAAEAEWLAYFERVLSAVPEAERNAALARHFKALDDTHRWLEFMARAHAGQDPVTHVNVLAGVPDRLEAQPAPVERALPQLLDTNASRAGGAGAMSPFASKVLEELQRSRDTLSFFPLRDLAAAGRSLPGPTERLLEMPLSHRHWLVTYGVCAHASGVLSGLPALRRFHDGLTKVMARYKTGSAKYRSSDSTNPLESMFTIWWMADLPCGSDNQTFLSVLADMAPALGAHPWLEASFRALAESRLGVYRVEVIDSQHVQLTELITERTFPVVLHDEREWRAPLWLARVLPPPDDSADDAALFDKAHELRADETEWRAYLERILSGVPEAERPAALARHFKAFDDSHRWLDYVKAAYVGQNPATRRDVLAGVPDRLETQPAPFTGPLPQLLNTSGEAVLLSTALFHVRDARAARRALEKWLGEPQGVSRWELREGDTVQATLELHGDDLRVECNTRQRLDTVKPLVKQRLGQAVKHRFDKHEDPNAESAEERSAKSRDAMVAPPPPEVAQMLQQTMLERVRENLDTPNPILDGKTPREAMKTERGREAVRQLLVRQQKIFEQSRAHWLDLSEVLEELGLVKKEPEITTYVRKLLASEKLSGPETEVILKKMFAELERRGQTPRTPVAGLPERAEPPETPERLKARQEKRWLDRLLSKGRLSGPQADDILDRVFSALERAGYVPPTVLDVSCTPGTLSACPASSTLVFSASGFRAGGYISAYAEALDHEADPIFYFSDEDGCPKLAQPAEGSRTEHTVPLSALHRRGRHRLHAFLADGEIGRDEMIEGTEDISGIAVRQQVEIVIVD